MRDLTDLFDWDFDNEITVNKMLLVTDEELMVEEDFFVQPEAPLIDKHKISEPYLDILSTKDFAVNLTRVNPVARSAGKMIFSFFIHNKSDVMLRFWVKNVKVSFCGEATDWETETEVYGKEYLWLTQLEPGEKQNDCMLCLADDQFDSALPFQGQSSMTYHTSIQIAVDFGEDEDLAESQRIFFDTDFADWRVGDDFNWPAPPPPQIPHICFMDFVVQVPTTVFQCLAHHQVESIRAQIDILRPDGDIITESVLAGYCRECDVYFLLEADFKRLKTAGVLQCRMVKLQEYERHGRAFFTGRGLSQESLLHQCGYNVNANANLSEVQRQYILKGVIDNRLYDGIQLTNFLDWLISRNENAANMATAVSKWITDREFVASYQPKSLRQAGIRSIKKR